MSPLPTPSPSPTRAAVRRVRLEAFTLVELLVVIAITGVLVSLLLPAVQAARESARRTQCVNNMRQLSLAVTGYSEASSMLPAAGDFGSKAEAIYVIPDTGELRIDMQAGRNTSWIVDVLPYLGESVLYDLFDPYARVATNPSNPQTEQPPSLLCPSDGSLGRFFSYGLDDADNPSVFAKSNYAGFVSPYHADQFHFAGPFSHFGLPTRKLTDGTAKTLMVSEVRTRDDTADQRGVWALPWAGSTLLAFDLHAKDVNDRPPTNRDSYIIDPRSMGVTQPPNSEQPDVLYRCSDTQSEVLEGMPCTLWRGKIRYSYISAAPRSSHPAGVNAAFADGHIMFLANDIDENAMLLLIRFNDGELINASWH